MLKNIFSISLLLTVVVIIACRSGRLPKSSELQYENVYKEQFRLTYFRQLLLKAYNHSDAVTELLSQDHSGFAEPVLAESDYRFIDSLVSIDNEILVADSLQSFRRAEGAGGKRPLGYIMNRIKGNWLDSLARSRMKLNGMPPSWK